jgi:AraC-like DNA-binding protein
MQWSFISAGIFSVGIAQGLFLLFMLFRHKKKSLHAFVMAIWVSALVSNLVLQFLTVTGFLSCTAPSSVITAFFPFLYSPFLLISCRTAGDAAYTPKKTVILHAIPFLLAILARYVIVAIIPDDTTPARMILLQLLNVPLFTGAVIYHVLSIRITVRYTIATKEYLSTDRQSYAAWIMTLVILSCSIWGIALVMAVTRQFSITILSVLYAVVVYVVSTKIVLQPELFMQEQKMLQTLKKNPVTPDITEEMVNTLRTYMKQSAGYRNPAVTIADVSSATGIPVYTISKILNNHLGLSFYQFINEYRVQEAKKLLSNPENNTRSVLDIGFSAGFNSKSAFNDVFRRSTGMTPSEFKKKGVQPLSSE